MVVAPHHPHHHRSVDPTNHPYTAPPITCTDPIQSHNTVQACSHANERIGAAAGGGDARSIAGTCPTNFGRRPRAGGRAGLPSLGVPAWLGRAGAGRGQGAWRMDRRAVLLALGRRRGGGVGGLWLPQGSVARRAGGAGRHRRSTQHRELRCCSLPSGGRAGAVRPCLGTMGVIGRVHLNARRGIGRRRSWGRGFAALVGPVFDRSGAPVAGASDDDGAAADRLNPRSDAAHSTACAARGIRAD